MGNVLQTGALFTAVTHLVVGFVGLVGLVWLLGLVGLGLPLTVTFRVSVRVSVK